MIIGFFIPYALISAELGTQYPSEGGMYTWVKKAFGKKWAGRVAWFYWVNFPLWIASLAEDTGAINGDGTGLATEGSWKYASNTLTVKGDSDAVTVANITGIDATTTVALSIDTVTVTRGGTNVVYGGVTLTSGAMDIETSSNNAITLQDAAVANYISGCNFRYR